MFSSRKAQSLCRTLSTQIRVYVLPSVVMCQTLDSRHPALTTRDFITLLFLSHVLERSNLHDGKRPLSANICAPAGQHTKGWLYLLICLRRTVTATSRDQTI